MKVEQPEEPDRAAGENPAERAVDPYRAPFDAMVRALAAQDPRFIRRVSAPGRAVSGSVTSCSSRAW